MESEQEIPVVKTKLELEGTLCVVCNHLNIANKVESGDKILCSECSTVYEVELDPE